MGWPANLLSGARALVTRALGSLRAHVPSRGTRLWNRLLGVGASGYPGSWSSDRTIQVQQLSGWQYVAIMALADEVACQRPHVAVRHTPEDVDQGRVRKSHLLSRAYRAKAWANALPHEELEAVDHDHPLLRLLANPNPTDTCETFWMRTVIYLRLCGICYWWLVRNKTDRPAEIWVLPAQWVWPKYGGENGDIIEWYEVRPYGMGLGGHEWLRIAPEDLLTFAYPHPLHPFDGLSPQQACGSWIDVAKSIDLSRFAQFKNNGWPGMTFTLSEQFHDPDDEELKAFRARLEQVYAGERNNGKFLILPPGMTSEPRSTTPVDMDYEAGFNQMRDAVLSTHRVSKSIAGITEEVNYASMVAARANFIYSAVRPLVMLIDGVITEKLCPQFDARLICYHEDKAPDDPAQKLSEWNAAFDRGCVTPNEYRAKMLGLEAYQNGGDDPLVGNSLSVLPLATGGDGLDLGDIPAGAAVRYEHADVSGTSETNASVRGAGRPGASGANAAPASNGQSGEPAPDQPPGTPAGQPQVHQTEERAGLLAKSGGIEGVLKVLSAMGEGAVERATAVQMLVLFYGLDQAAAEKLIGQSGQKQEPPPGAAPLGSNDKPPSDNGNGDGTVNRIAELVGKALIAKAEHWEEGRHSRADDGKFGSGGGSGTSGSPADGSPTERPPAEREAIQQGARALHAPPEAARKWNLPNLPMPLPHEERPYPYPKDRDRIINDEDFPTQQLDPANLTATQDFVRPDKLLRLDQAGAFRQDKGILVVRHNGKDYIEEGHHRAIKALRDGTPVPAKVVEIGPDGRLQPVAKSLRKALAVQPAGGADVAAETAPVPPIAQGTNWTCGPAALLAVCERYGIGATEESIAELAGTDPESGTPPEAMLATAQRLGLSATARSGMTLDDLAQAAGDHSPVILCFQDIAYPVDGNDAGHWGVLIGMEPDAVLLHDPLRGQVVKVSRAEFAERWHDEAGSGERYPQYGIVISGREEGAVEKAGWDEGAHKRGQPGNAGQFGAGGGGAAAKPGTVGGSGAQAKKKEKRREGAASETAAVAAAVAGNEPAARQAGLKAGLKALGSGIAEKAQALLKAKDHYEHAALEWTKSNIAANVAKLPDGLPKACAGLWWGVRGATAVAFSSYTMGQAAAEAVAKERGLSDDQAAKFRQTLSGLDMKALEIGKVTLIGAHVLGLALPGVGHVVAEAPLWVPVASLTYLTYSTATNPLATLRAAGKALAKVPGAVRDKLSAARAKLTGKALEPGAPEQPEILRTLADRIKATDGSDWYMALLYAAWQDTDDLADAIELADAAFAELPEPPADEEAPPPRPSREHRAV